MPTLADDFALVWVRLDMGKKNLGGTAWDDAIAAFTRIAERQHVDRCDCHRIPERDADCHALRRACKGER